MFQYFRHDDRCQHCNRGEFHTYHQHKHSIARTEATREAIAWDIGAAQAFK